MRRPRSTGDGARPVPDVARARAGRSRIVACLALAMACSLAAPRPAGAHKGPPFALLVDRIVGPYLISVWADPDIGTGTFFVVMSPATEGDELVPPTSVRVAVAPVSGRLPEATYEARRERSRQGARYVAEVEFDRGEFWDVRMTIDSPEGGGELVSRVEATPDGSIGPLGLLVYSFPFVLVGVLWWRAAAARRRMEEEARREA